MFGSVGQEVFRSAKQNNEILNDIVSNVSNIQSIGYKKAETNFAETLDGSIQRFQTRNFAQGLLRRTAEPLDLALDGKGFFEVELPDGQRAYTRAGRFGLSSEGELVTQEGYKVLPQIEAISKPAPMIFNPEKIKEDSEIGLNLKISSPKLIIPTDVVPEVKEDGTIYGVNSRTGEKVRYGKLNVVVFNNPQGLESISKSYYTVTKESGNPQEIKPDISSATQVKQGFVEGSNVDTAKTFMELAQMKNILGAQFKVLKSIDKIYENIHYTISRSS